MILKYKNDNERLKFDNDRYAKEIELISKENIKLNEQCEF
jgi:hypothetical protein